MNQWPANFWDPLFPRVVKQLHPIVIHFPIAFLFLEFGLILAYWIRPSQRLDEFARLSLWLAVLSSVPAIFLGLNDAGADLGPGWQVLNGLNDRIAHFGDITDQLSLHVIYALLVVALATARLIWRTRTRRQVLMSHNRLLFTLATALNIWLLFAAGQLGGSMGHQ